MKTKILGLLSAALIAGAPSADASSVLQQLSPSAVSYTNGVDFALMGSSPFGDVTASVSAVDLMLGAGNTSTSGCEAVDFLGFSAGNIALIQRGTCTFEQKAENAAAAGAVGVLLFNQGNDPSRLGLFSGTLTLDYTGGIPVFALTYALGETFAGLLPGLTVHMVASSEGTPVPEPGTLALLGLGLAGLSLSRGRMTR